VRVLVTRPAEEQPSTRRALAEAGHEALSIPIMRIEACVQDLPPSPITALVVTSAQGVRHLEPAIRNRLLALPLHAVGEGTATAARAAGFCDVRTGPGDAAGLAEGLSGIDPPSLLYLAGTPRTDGIETRLPGIEVLETYRTLAVEEWSETAFTACSTHGWPDAVLHFSARQAALVAAAVLADERLSPLRRALHVAISANVAAALTRHGFQPRVSAAPTKKAMIALLPHNPPHP
jgi:uroporphyrinogen-III synthase